MYHLNIIWLVHVIFCQFHKENNCKRIDHLDSFANDTTARLFAHGEEAEMTSFFFGIMKLKGGKTSGFCKIVLLVRRVKRTLIKANQATGKN